MKSTSFYFESVKQAQFIPETVEFFTLSRYQEEIGKDYKRIVLYLCSQMDGNSAEHGYRPVYTLRFVGLICRPDSVGAQIVRVF